MPKESKAKLRCPICKKPVSSTGADLPFCSDRCRTVDLGKWASGQYVVSSPVDDVSDELQADTDRHSDDED